jgi:hypothetical protein
MDGAEGLVETFIREQVRSKAHAVTRVEESDTCMLVHIDWRASGCCAARLAGSVVWKCTTSEESGSGAICPCGSCP